MNFKETIEILKSLSNIELPGIDAQYKLAPYARKDRGAARRKDTNPKISAVLALIYEQNTKAYILLMKRNTYKGVHSAQIGFPGGKKEKSDISIMHTALRETEEEMGISPDIIHVVKQLTDVYIPPSRFLVHPFIGYTEQQFEIIPDPIEVADTIKMPLSDLLDDNIILNKEVLLSNGLKINTPCFYFKNQIIWGATAMILSEIKELLLNAS